MNWYSLPYDDSSNKYFALWRHALSDRGVTVSPLPRGGILGLSISASSRRAVLIIHWSTTWYGSHSAFVSIAKLLINGGALLLLKLRGACIVWVVHNRSAHEYPHPFIDRIGRAFTAFVSGRIIVQQEEMKPQFMKRYPHTQIAYIPHGNYVGAYGALASSTERAQMRKKLGCTEDDTVLICLGAMRPYKQIENIIQAVLCAHNPQLVLYVVGKAKPEYEQKLRKLLPEHARIYIENKYISDPDIPLYLAVADYSVFFYDDTELTSGGILLSLSYGIPAISRAIPGASMVKKGKNGYIFTNEDELISLLIRLTEHPRPPSETVVASIAGLDWDSIARQYTKFI